MVAPSYKGETQMARCEECGYKCEIPCDEFEQSKDVPYKGHCPECDKQVMWEPKRLW